MEPGTQVGAYKLIEPIGAGGMGQVWLAEHSALGRRAAVKLLHPDFSGRSEIVSRFFNEARAATAISDPGIVQIFDFGHHTDGTAFIVMELLVGEGLDKRVRRLGPMPPQTALRIIRQVAKSLGAAHACGIVHRDLKPENIYLVPDDEVAGGERAKILDFGIAKLQGDTSGWRTNTSQVMGTPLYMSPEQCRGAGTVDQRSDIYSIGCMLFVLLTGRPPFWAEGSGELIAMHLREAPPHASQFNTRVPPEVDALIARCLAKDPAARFLNGIELANAISELLGTGQQPSRPPPAAPSDPQIGQAVTTLSSSSGALSVGTPQTAPTVRKSRSRALLAGGAVVVAGIVVVAVIANSAKDSNKGSSTRTPEPATAVAIATTADAAVAPPPTQPGPPVVASKPDEMPNRMLQVVAGFLKWAPTHKGAACPTPKDLTGTPVDDAWGRPMKITCTGQPDNQVIGIVSMGPDGVAGNADDISSWTMPPSVTNLIAGPRWTAKKTGSTGGARVGGGTSSSGGGVIDLDGDGIPDER